jgi:ribosomal-protein-alanine N-acetyltransferase
VTAPKVQLAVVIERSSVRILPHLGGFQAPASEQSDRLFRLPGSPLVSKTEFMRAPLIRPFRDGEANEVAAWAYEPPYEIYNGNPENEQLYLAIDPDGYGYYAVVDADSDELIGFCCFGQEARVKGQEEAQGTVDIGGGVRPDLLSEGVATRLLPLIMDFARDRFAPEQFRTAVASFNERSARLCLSSGFEVVRRFDGPGCEFQELLRPV